MQEAMLKQRKVTIAVVEDGGEIAVKFSDDILIALYSLSTALKTQLGFKYNGDSETLGISTSSVNSVMRLAWEKQTLQPFLHLMPH